MKSIAFVSTVCFPISHCDVMLSRWNIPLPGDGAWGWSPPGVRAVSLYVAQHPENDISLKVAESQSVAIFPDIESALTLGTGTVAVDGVALVAEHGEYPDDERGVKLYPRKEMFDEIIRVLDAHSRRIPIFCDKHLSWNPLLAREMVEACRVREIPFFGGSGLSFTDYDPEIPPRVLDAAVESLSIFFDGEEIYGFHSIEGSLSFLEQRAGGEAGIRSMRVLKGDAAFAALAADAPAHELFRAAMAAAGADADAVPREKYERPVFITFVHADGLRSHHFHVFGVLKKFSHAVRSRSGEIAAGRSVNGPADTHYAHFATLNRAVERLVETGASPAPIARTLLATCALARVMDLLHTGGGDEFVATPDLAIPYLPLRKPRYSRSIMVAESDR